MPPGIQRLVRAGSLLALGTIAVYGLIFGDLWLRSRQAYKEGEKYLRWHHNPEEKNSRMTQEFQKWKAHLDKLLKRKRITPEDYRERLELAEFDRDERIKESSVKYAYVWFKTAVELFSPPENMWIRRARIKMVETKEIWKKELKANNVPYEDYMLE